VALSIKEKMASVALASKEHLREIRSEAFLKACCEALESRADFSLDVEFNGPLLDDNGIYLFWVKIPTCLVEREKALDHVLKVWDGERVHLGVIKYPKVVKKRARETLLSNKENEWVPLYIGKTENLAKRVAEHIDLSSDKATYSMKLRASRDLFSKHKWEFAVSTISFGKLGDAYYLCEIVESELRKILKPVIGKQ